MGHASRATMFLAVPILVGFMTLGGEFITVWMGPGYGRSAWVLLILTVARFGALANEPVGTTLLALGHVRLCAAMTVVQSLAALALSVGLVLMTNLGIYGIAIGTALPMIATHNLWLFVAGYRSVGGHLWAAARSTVLRWAGGAVLFAIPCLSISHVIPQSGWLSFWLKVAIVSIIYLPIGLFIVLLKEERMQILRQVERIRGLAVQFLSRVCRRRGNPVTAEVGHRRGGIDARQADTLLP